MAEQDSAHSQPRRASVSSDHSDDVVFETPSGGEDVLLPRKDDGTPFTPDLSTDIADVANLAPAASAVTPPRVVDDNATLAALAASSAGAPLEAGQNADTFVLVASLRSQITDLTSQVTSLNTKLVTSYTRIGDLDDDLHDRTDELSHFKLRVAALERSKESWEREIEGGGWVERDHVQTEMRGLMTKVLEEAKERETAVEAHSKLETEIENLTSSLFTEANRMVAVERFARARAEEKMRSLEESASVMTSLFDELQTSMRQTVEKLEQRDRDVAELRQRLVAAGASPEGLGTATESSMTDNGVAIFSDGYNMTDVKSVSALPHRPSPPDSPSLAHQHSEAIRALQAPRLLTSVLPYHEFIAFVTYLRQLRVTVLSRPQEYAGYPHHPYASSSITTRGFGAGSHPPTPPIPQTPATPAMLLATHLPLSAHTSQPFVKRCVEEDSDPSIRLDLAPGLGFLSRRNVSTAILDGTLLIEPAYSGSALPSATCALCGTGLERWWAGGEIIPAPASSANAKVNQTMRKVLGGGSWSIPNFAARSPKDPAASPRMSSAPPTPSEPVSGETPFSFPHLPHQQIHIFRINDTSTSRYAICPNYCLPRLRTVCEFWTYVRAIERGLLLEEGFHFVGGKGVNGALTESRNGSGSNLSLGGSSVSLGGGVKSRSSLVGIKSVENLAHANAAAGLVPLDRQGADAPVAVVISEEEAVPRDLDEARQTEQAVDVTPVENVTTVEVVAPEASAVPDAEEAKEGDDEDLKVPTSPMTSAPSSPMLGQNSSTGSLNKPPVPKRSEARRPSTPNPTAMADATAAHEEREKEEATTPVKASPPKLPPRNTTPQSVSGGVKATMGGNKTVEIGGTVDAMEIVGGATGWEDRCWTEVVRLKESMFWTRMAREPTPDEL